jgi:glycosyltransferase involved in cell wall biosynthesis
MIKIAFHILGSEVWHAGTVYLFNLIKAMKQFAESDVELSLLLSNEGNQIPEDLKNLVGEILFYPKYRRWTLPWLASRIGTRLLRHDLWTDRFFEQRGVQVIAFGKAPQGSRIPLLSWFPDFQHIHMPEMFSPPERAHRERSFSRIAEESTRIILLSETVRQDFQSFLPRYADKVRVIHPVSYIAREIYDAEPRSVCDIYSLPDKFFYLPNQFWKHKHHSLVFRAMKILKDKGIQVFIVCSGPMNDYRHPLHFSDLLQQVSQLEIRNQVAFLGLVPRQHVYMMIRQSICVLSPSVFEGFGMIVDEARSIGKRLLLSDIEAHREQKPPRAVFFRLTEEVLSNKMKLVWQEQLPGPDLELEAEARKILPARLKAFGESFMSVVREVV